MAVTNVEAGTSIAEDSHDSMIRYIVGESCGQNNGHWMCVTHGEHFQNNMMFHSHCDRDGEHVVAWWCAFDGPEVP